MSQGPGKSVGPVRIGLLAMSPIPYQVPLYRRLAQDPRLDFTVLYASSEGVRPFSEGYGRPVSWDADLLGGYQSVFLARADRTAKDSAFRRNFDRDLLRVLRNGSFEVLWLHGYHTAIHLAAALLQRLRGRPILFREEQTLLEPRALWRRAAKTLGLRLVTHNSSGLFIGTENRAWMHHYGIRSDREFHVPYCVENEELRGSAVALGAHESVIKRQLGVSGPGPTILMVGRLVAKKQPVVALRAFAEVRRRVECNLLVVGSGPEEPELRRVIREEAIPDVTLAGFINQSALPRVYAASDLFLLYSGWDETWGMVVNEAMNFGLPVVVSDRVGSAYDLVIGQDTGVVVPADSPDRLVAALEELVRDEPLRCRLGQNALNVVADWNYDVAVDGVIRAVAKAVGPARWQEASRPLSGRRAARPRR